MESTARPNIRVPPPAFFLAGFLLGLWLEAGAGRTAPAAGLASPLTRMLAGSAIIVVGAVLAVWGVMTFKRAGTTWLPEPATSLVQSGPYSFTRNPMYLGLTIAYIGAAVMLDAAWPLLLLPAVLAAVYRFVIRMEERYLSERFGEEYRAYRRRARRWL